MFNKVTMNKSHGILIGSSNMTTGSVDNFIRNIALPEPVSFPHSIHLFNRNVLGFRYKECGEDCHNNNEEGKEKEKSELQVAEQG